jgi:uncharacterized membrane protein YkvA (DUF1232 family)
MTATLERLKTAARELEREVVVLAIAARDPRTPWTVKALVLAVVAYAASPIDLIPDFIPVLGYLDELILLPLALRFILRLVPAQVLADARAQADARSRLPRSRAGAAIVVAIWLALLGAAAWWWFAG